MTCRSLHYTVSVSSSCGSNPSQPPKGRCNERTGSVSLITVGAEGPGTLDIMRNCVISSGNRSVKTSELDGNIHINHTSLVETAGRASFTYLSTLAVLQLDAILQNAKVCFVDKPKSGNKQQNKFERMIGMEYSCPGIGDVQLMVGVRKRDKMKIQYCITAMTPVLRLNKKSSRR